MMMLHTYLLLAITGLILPHSKFPSTQADIVKTYLIRTLTPKAHQVEKSTTLETFRQKFPAHAHKKFEILQNLIYETAEFERWLNRKKIPDHILEGLTKRIARLDTPAGQVITANKEFFLNNAFELRKSKKISDFPPARVKAIARSYYQAKNPYYLRRMTREYTPIANRILWKIVKGKVPFDEAALNKLDRDSINRIMTGIEEREKKGETRPEWMLDELLQSMNLTDSEFAEYLLLPNDVSGMPTYEYLSQEFLEYNKYQMNRFLKDL